MQNTATTTSRLKIIELNTRSIVSLRRRHELNSFLKSNNPDVALLCETNLQEKHRVKFQNYCFVRSNRLPGTMQRGTGILLKDKIDYTEADVKCWNLTSIECTAVQINTNSRPLTIVAIYRNVSDYTNINFINDLDKICAALQPIGPFIIGGDFNARHIDWNNTKNCRHGTLLANWLLQSTLIYDIKLEYSKEPTFYCATGRSHIDLFIISASINIEYSQSLGNSLEIADFSSDHRAVILPIQLAARPIRRENRTIRNFAKANWPQLRMKVEESVENIVPKSRNMNPSEIDEAVAKITSLINTSVNEEVPLVQSRAYGLINLPQETVDLIEHKNRLRRRWQRSKYSQDAHQLKSDINNLNKIIQDRIRIAHAEHWTKTLNNVKMDRNTFKNINRLSARVAYRPIPTLNNGNNTATSPQEKAEALASHFESVHKTNNNIGNQFRTDFINAQVSAEFNGNFNAKVTYNQFCTADPSVRFDPNAHLTSIPNITSIIKSRANKKSCGNDNLPNTVLKKLGKRFVATLATLLNQAYNVGYFPNKWKEAKIIPILKQGQQPTNPNNYRPISLLPCLSKIFERALCDVINHSCEDQQLFPDDQFGFRAGRSTIHPVTILQKEIVTKFMAKSPTVAITIDIQKAFDTTWIEGLIFKMAFKFHFDRQLCRIIHSYLTGRTFNVQVNESSSRTHPISAGVPQGGVLSATLYILYISDMPSPPQHTNPIKRLQFADDMLLYVSTRNLYGAKERLEDYVTTIFNYLRNWKLVCNPDKCEAIIFKSTNAMNTRTVNRVYKNIAIKIGDKLVLPSGKIKYLGVIFQTNAQHTRHIDHITKKAATATAIIRPILKKVDGLDRSIKMLLYKQLIRPILTYAFPCWTNVTSSQMERLRIAERKCLRLCTNYRRDIGCFLYCNNSLLYERANSSRIDVTMITNALKFFDRCRHSESALILEICSPQRDLRFAATPKIQPPDFVMHLNNDGILFNNGQLMHYHRRFDGQEGHVYKTGQ